MIKNLRPHLYLVPADGSMRPGLITHVTVFPFALTARQHLELYLAYQGKRLSLWQRIRYWLTDLWHRQLRWLSRGAS